MKISKRLRQNHDVTMYKGDCFDLLEQLPDEFVDLTVSSPPYCMGKEYEASTDYNDFIALHEKLLPQLLRVTKSGGSICWQVGSHVSKVLLHLLIILFILYLQSQLI